MNLNYRTFHVKPKTGWGAGNVGCSYCLLMLIFQSQCLCFVLFLPLYLWGQLLSYHSFPFQMSNFSTNQIQRELGVSLQKQLKVRRNYSSQKNKQSKCMLQIMSISFSVTETSIECETLGRLCPFWIAPAVKLIFSLSYLSASTAVSGHHVSYAAWSKPQGVFLFVHACVTSCFVLPARKDSCANYPDLNSVYERKWCVQEKLVPEWVWTFLIFNGLET